MNIDSQFGLRLKDERKRLGLSQQGAAASVGVSREMWGKYERGAKPGSDVIELMNKAGFNLQYLLAGDNTLAVQISVEEIALIDKFRLSPLQAQAAVLNLLDITAKREPKLTSYVESDKLDLKAAQTVRKYKSSDDNEPLILDLDDIRK